MYEIFYDFKKENDILEKFFPKLEKNSLLSLIKKNCDLILFKKNSDSDGGFIDIYANIFLDKKDLENLVSIPEFQGVILENYIPSEHFEGLIDDDEKASLCISFLVPPKNLKEFEEYIEGK